MIKIENDCVSCEHCGHCGQDRMPHFYCDWCKEEVYELYKYLDKHICKDCLVKQFDEVTEDDVKEVM